MQHPVQKRPKRSLRPSLKIALAIVAALLATALLLLVPVIKARVPSPNAIALPPDSPVRTLYLGDAAQLESLTVQPLHGEAFTLRMLGETLKLERNGELLAINEAFASDLLKAATQITVQGTVAENAATVAEQLADMGLEPPQVTARAVYRDGSIHTLQIGHEVPHTPYTYYRWSGDEGVYMCDSGIPDALLLTPSRLLPVPRPRIVKELTDTLTLQTSAETLRMSFTQDDAGLMSGTLEAPYRYPMDTQQTAAVLTALGSFHLGTLEATATASARAAYGLDEPLCRLTLHQATGYSLDADENGSLITRPVEASDLSFVIGRAEGDYFYTCEYEGSIYLISRLPVEPLVNATAAKLSARKPADMGNAEPVSVRIETQDGLADLQVAEDGSVTLNGAPLEAAAYEALLNRLRALTVTGDLPHAWTPPTDGKPRWSIALKTAGGQVRTIEAFPLDAFSDALRVDGVYRHYVHADAIETLIADLGK